ncbi:MAG: formate dehydrogenase accessory sulfurtransferase FdhD [Verrucomicrobiota bacterium]|jgi:FdhD protein
MKGAASVKAGVMAYDRTRGWLGIQDDLAAEEPLEIRVDTRPVSVTMRTPGHDEELAAGFLLTEGILRRGDEIARFHAHPRNASGAVLDVQLHPDVRVDLGRLTRHVFAASSCGLCGKAAIEAVRAMHPPVEDAFEVDVEWLLGIPARMREAQATFETTGGLHAAALFDANGGLVVLREDVGRHNAVDKVVGHRALQGGGPARRMALLVSGRLSFEILQKALAAGIALVAAVSAPSSLAVEFARDSGQTLVGFLRDGRFNVYAGPGRIGGCSDSSRK